jgi:hypothetical protein
VLNFNCYTSKFDGSTNHPINSKGHRKDTWLIKFKSLWDMTSPKRFVVWIITSNLKLCYACLFYVVICILYYCNIVWILYIWKCHMEHFILYIEYYRNNQMCEICLMDIFYTWRENISILLWGIREILQSLNAIVIRGYD